VDRDEDAAATKRSSCRGVGGGTCAEDSPEVVVLLERGDEPVFVAGSLAWGIVADGFRPDRWDYFGATICLAGVAVIMFAPRTA
jgi:hypothetical protein